MRIIVDTLNGTEAIDLDRQLNFGDIVRVLPSTTDLVVINWSIISYQGRDTQYVKTLALTGQIIHTIPFGQQPTCQEIDELNFTDYVEPEE